MFTCVCANQYFFRMRCHVIQMALLINGKPLVTLIVAVIHSFYFLHYDPDVKSVSAPRCRNERFWISKIKESKKHKQKTNKDKQWCVIRIAPQVINGISLVYFTCSWGDSCKCISVSQYITNDMRFSHSILLSKAYSVETKHVKQLTFSHNTFSKTQATQFWCSDGSRIW